MKKVIKTFSLAEDLYNKLLELQKEKSFSTVAATLQYCIIECYERHMRNDKRIKKAPEVDEKTAEERRLQKEETRCREIAKRLEGKIIQSGDGFEVEYFTHSKQGSYKQVVPLLSLKEDHVQKQYFPSREIVESYWAKNGKEED